MLICATCGGRQVQVRVHGERTKLGLMPRFPFFEDLVTQTARSVLLNRQKAMDAGQL